MNSADSDIDKQIALALYNTAKEEYNELKKSTGIYYTLTLINLSK